MAGACCRLPPRNVFQLILLTLDEAVIGELPPVRICLAKALQCLTCVRQVCVLTLLILAQKLLTYVFSCRTKLEKLLCLNDRGSRSLENSAGFQTTKLQQAIHISNCKPVLCRQLSKAEVRLNLCPSPLQETTSLFSALSIRSYLHNAQYITLLLVSIKMSRNQHSCSRLGEKRRGLAVTTLLCALLAIRRGGGRLHSPPCGHVSNVQT